MGSVEDADTGERERLYREAEAEVKSFAEESTLVGTQAGSHGQMCWRIWGEGRPLVLVHGGGGSWSHWIRNIPVLARRFRVIAPDLPGFGDSQMPTLPADPAEMADIVAAGLRDVLGSDAAADFVAFSFGGVVSGHVAARHPGLVSSLTLVGAVGLGVTRHPAPKMTRTSPDMPIPNRWSVQIGNLKTLMIADEGKIDPLAIYLQDHNAMRTRLRSRPMSRADSLGPLLPHLSCPIRAVWGRQDAVYPEDTGERVRLLESLTPPGSALFLDPGGHWVQHEQADSFNAYLLEALCQDDLLLRKANSA